MKIFNILGSIKKHKYKYIIVTILLIIGLIVGIYFGVKKGGNSPTPQHSKDLEWLSNLYKKLNWKGVPANSNADKTVPDNWITWAKENPNALLQYYVNWRRSSQQQELYFPTSNIEFNPAYAWDGLVYAIELWNKAVDVNNSLPNDKKLFPVMEKFCGESDMNARLMNLAAFLANATVESAYFLVCKESTVLNVKYNKNCPGKEGVTTGSNRFNPRYFNNCDQANPMTYSCQGGSGGNGTCNPKAADGGCSDCPNGCCGGNHVCYDGISKEKCSSYKGTMCTSDKPTTTTAPTKPFDPINDKCTGGWPVCQAIPGQEHSNDPCMSDPHADGSNRDQLSNETANCSDWNGNQWNQQQECYFGRGLIQLTWSCNYYKIQYLLNTMVKLLKDDSSQLAKQFINSMNADFKSDESCNICANPDILCGDTSYVGDTSEIKYSKNIIKRAIPWLACIIYWCTHADSPKFLKCYSFSVSYSIIAPSGAGNYPGRVSAYKQLLEIMGVNSSYYKVSKNSSGAITNICRVKDENGNTCDCTASSPTGNTINICGTNYDNAIADYKSGNYKTCPSGDPAECNFGSNCFAVPK
jgi:predicted chitinase